VQVYEAIAHVISAMSMEQAAGSLRTFALDILTSIHSASVQPTEVSKDNSSSYAVRDPWHFMQEYELMVVEDSLECLETMLSVVRTFGNDLPAVCQTTCQEAWSCLDIFIGKYGSDYDASDRVTRLIRHGLTFFGSAALPVASAVSFKDDIFVRDHR
jgi:transportin-3